MNRNTKALPGTVLLSVPAARCLVFVRMRTYKAAREAARKREQCRYGTANDNVLVKGNVSLLHVCYA